MNTQLQPIEYNNQIVITTSQLAGAYETDSRTINKNFANNRERYILDKHYFCLEGEELKVFKNSPQNLGVVDSRTSNLYFWTEKGVLLHAKSLGTDKAWEVYEKLVDEYFRVTRSEPLRGTEIVLTSQMDIVSFERTYDALSEARNNLALAQKQLENAQLAVFTELDAFAEREEIVLDWLYWRCDRVGRIKHLDKDWCQRAKYSIDRARQELKGTRFLKVYQ